MLLPRYVTVGETKSSGWSSGHSDNASTTTVGGWDRNNKDALLLAYREDFLSSLHFAKEKFSRVRFTANPGEHSDLDHRLANPLRDTPLIAKMFQTIKMETTSKIDISLNFQEQPEKLRDQAWDIFIENPHCIPEAHFFSISETKIPCQIAPYYGNPDDQDESVDVYVPYGTHLQPSLSEPSADSSLWSVHRNKSAYLADNRLWNICDESRAHLVRRWRKVHQTCAYDGLTNIKFPAADGTAAPDAYITMRPGRDLICLDNVDDVKLLRNEWANNLGGMHRARNIGFQLPPYWKYDVFDDSIVVDRVSLYNDMNRTRSTLSWLLYFLEGLESMRIYNEPWREAADKGNDDMEEEWDSIFIVDPLMTPNEHFDVNQALHDKDRKVFRTRDGYLVEVKRDEYMPKPGVKSKWTRPEHFYPWVTSCGFDLKENCIEPYLMESLARTDGKTPRDYPASYSGDDYQEKVDKHYRIPNVYVLAPIPISSTTPKNNTQTCPPDMDLFAEEIWAKMGFAHPDTGTVWDQMGSYVRKVRT